MIVYYCNENVENNSEKIEEKIAKYPIVYRRWPKLRWIYQVSIAFVDDDK